MDIIAGMLVDHARVGDVEEVTHRLLGDDVHHAGDSVRAVHRRTAAADHLDAVDHRRRHLLQTIDRGHAGEDRTAVHQDLRVLALQTVDAQFRLAAVGAGVLYPQTRLEVQRVRYAGYCGRLE